MYKKFKLVMKILDELSVRTEFSRLFLVDDQFDRKMAEALDKTAVKDVRKWAIKKMETRYRKALEHRDYHQKEIDSLNLEAGRLAMFLNRIIK